MHHHSVGSLPFGTAKQHKMGWYKSEYSRPILTRYTLYTEMDTLPIKSEGNQYFLLSLLGMMGDFKRGSAGIPTHPRWSTYKNKKETNINHIPCDRLVILYLINWISQTVINNNLSRSCYMFRPVQGHHQGCIYKSIANSVNDMNVYI